MYNQFPPETKDYVPMVIAAAWLYLHPKEYGLTFPKVDARPTTIRLARPASIYELTICLGNGGTRDGYMRVLRNLNPRYEPDSWIPAGANLNATVKMAGLYNRWCAQGARADLAKQLVMSDANSAIVRTARSSHSVAAANGASVAAVAAQPKLPRDHRVERGDTLVSIAQRYSCDAGLWRRPINSKRRATTIRPGQRLKLKAVPADPEKRS